MRQTPDLYSVSSHTRRSISGVTSATAAVIRIRSFTTFAGRGSTYTRSLTKPPPRKNPAEYDGGGGETWPCYRRCSTNPLTWETGVKALADVSMVMRGCTVLLEMHASFVVVFAKLWKEELFEHVQVVKRFLKHPVYKKRLRLSNNIIKLLSRSSGILGV
jgi:hypothetical protein